MRIVLVDDRRRSQEFDIDEDTREVILPDTAEFSALGMLPTHIHALTRDGGRSYTRVGMFVRRADCRFCR